MKKITILLIYLLLSIIIFAQKTNKIKGFPGINSVITYNFSIEDTSKYDLKDITKKDGILINVLKIFKSGYNYVIFYLDKIDKIQ